MSVVKRIHHNRRNFQTKVDRISDAWVRMKRAWAIRRRSFVVTKCLLNWGDLIDFFYWFFYQAVLLQFWCLPYNPTHLAEEQLHGRILSVEQVLPARIFDRNRVCSFNYFRGLNWDLFLKARDSWVRSIGMMVWNRVRWTCDSKTFLHQLVLLFHFLVVVDLKHVSPFFNLCGVARRG